MNAGLLALPGSLEDNATVSTTRPQDCLCGINYFLVHE
jgi:hypothetical protein